VNETPGEETTLTTEAGPFYDRYWGARETPRAEARSRERAGIAARLLAAHGLAAGRVLDVGCGPGWSLEVLRQAGYTLLGVDVAEAAVAAARARGFEVRRVDLEAAAAGEVLPGGEPACDAAVALEVLEHLSDPAAALEKVFACVKPGGPVVVSLPNEVHLIARLAMLAGRLPFGGHEDPHLRHFDRRRARELFAAAGARVVKEQAVSVVPPRWAPVRAAAAPAVWLLPGAFAIATVYLLVRER
jgi:2-polyprenyl-3-methyl-5-hydroxy-6-metoxy-1,4-benzoquinol methylase